MEWDNGTGRVKLMSVGSACAALGFGFGSGFGWKDEGGKGEGSRIEGRKFFACCK